MKVCILDEKNKSLDDIMSWLSECQNVSEVVVFDDYTKMLCDIEAVPPSLCIIRLGAEGIPGLKISKLIKAQHPEIMILFVSDSKDYAIEAYEVGANGYLVTPASRQKLENYLNCK